MGSRKPSSFFCLIVLELVDGRLGMKRLLSGHVGPRAWGPPVRGASTRGVTLVRAKLNAVVCGSVESGWWIAVRRSNRCGVRLTGQLCGQGLYWARFRHWAICVLRFMRMCYFD
eukprot:scaffold740_cov405-Prasinococcus_capsulatus_cf.AAC.16